MQVVRIFTDKSISPSPSPRQCPNRYAFRAGRNLPDKEFRYLRTVIVTAAVHRGFSYQHKPISLTFRHWAGVSPHTSSYDLAETCVFDKQLLGSCYCNLICIRHSFFRSYGVILPSSLERVISRPLVYSTYPPVSVMVQAFFIYDSASFSWKSDIHYFDALASRIHASTQGVFSTSQHLERLNR